jgi:hypothetical protein
MVRAQRKANRYPILLFDLIVAPHLTGLVRPLTLSMNALGDRADNWVLHIRAADATQEAYKCALEAETSITASALAPIFRMTKFVLCTHSSDR